MNVSVSLRHLSVDVRSFAFECSFSHLFVYLPLVGELYVGEHGTCFSGWSEVKARAEQRKAKTAAFLGEAL